MIYIIFLLGLVLLLTGAHALVEGAGSLALRLGISKMAIGLTVVALGTSAPEMLVSLISAFKDSTDIAVGNVVGSNLANFLLILGAAALIAPLSLEKTLRWREIPFVLLATLLLAVLANDHLLSQAPGSLLDRGDGLALLIFFTLFMYYVFSMARQTKAQTEQLTRQWSIFMATILLTAGIAGLALGGHWLVKGATGIAISLGMSQALVGLTIVAIGTSLPELATSVVAATKNNADMAVGNVVGSNIFNILWILGLTSTITPVSFNLKLNSDIWFLVAVTVLFFVFTFTGKKHKVDRIEGLLFVSLYLGYLIFLVLRG